MPEPSSPIPDGPTEAERCLLTGEMVMAASMAMADIYGAGVSLQYEGIARRVITAALSVSPLREQVQKLTEENERLRREFSDLHEHHRQCEMAGTKLAELVKREVIGGSGGVDDNDLIAAAEQWDAHQWPALSPIQKGEQ